MKYVSLWNADIFNAEFSGDSKLKKFWHCLDTSVMDFEEYCGVLWKTTEKSIGLDSLAEITRNKKLNAVENCQYMYSRTDSLSENSS